MLTPVKATRYAREVIAISGPPLVGTTEIATMLGVSRQRVSQLAKSPAFPKPLVTLAQGPIWDRTDIIGWAEAAGRSLRI